MVEMTNLPEDPRPEDSPVSAAIGGGGESWWKIRLALMRRSFRDNWKIFRRNKVGVFGLVIIAFWGIMAVMPTVFFATGFWTPAVYDPVTGLELDPPTRTMTMVERITDPNTEIDRRAVLLDGRIPDTLQIGDTFELPLQPAPPDGRHWLGTDPLGRDILSQLMHGARASFFLGIVAAVVTVVIGTTIGSVAAYFGGMVDSFLMRLADLLIMIPGVALLIVIGAVFTYQLWHLAVVIGVLSGFGGTAIVLKSQALAVKVKPFIDAARVAGGSARHIIFYHLIPNVMPLSVLYMMFTVTGAIQSEAVLSFLGIFNTDTSWGLMMNLARTQGYLLQVADFWWLTVPAGLAVTLLSGAFFLVGRGMDEIVNPRLRRR
ncbi:MAG: ABC transporter permease [Acidimicrobiia bacterium]|nr:ABC transporter permease [bacterium]MXX01223.1 ABC transporter permease [Acidimicrobiia bacterium]MDE0675680.1 ABC transporter permease [bacterium]MXX45303.1 ABC transporter permease [Acidimicrobiia bacterium]MXY75143.1 ABC transporter permease [Acidimicrobiia bacterium]